MNTKHLVSVSVGVIASLTVACGYSIKTATDYDRTVPFSNYHSFFILKGNSSGNPLMDQRAQADVETALTSKGWMEVPEGQGQAAVVVHASRQSASGPFMSFRLSSATSVTSQPVRSASWASSSKARSRRRSS